jgi:hypothetical protein
VTLGEADAEAAHGLAADGLARLTDGVLRAPA